MVSVIIPYYNASAWIERTLDSCLIQKDLLKEIIIIDDFSSDAGPEIIASYQARFPGLIITRKNSQKGGNNARNLGYDLSSGEYIQWLDADDQLLPGKFAAQLDSFSKHAGADIVYSDWQLDIYDGSGALGSTEYKFQRQHEDFLLELLIDNWSPPHNYLVKRSFAEELRKINAWNPATPSFQDREYYTLAAVKGGKFQYTPGIFSVYNRWSKQSVSQDKKKSGVLLGLFSEFAAQIEMSDELGAVKKKYYKKVILTSKLLTRLSRNGLLVFDKEIKPGNICWPVVQDHRTRAKILFALTLNLFS
jgi:glycosyltransferase involved in cell wall biosynthesis